MEPKRITREEAHELVEEAQFGILVTAEMDPVPVLGTPDPENFKVRVGVDAFQFGEEPPEDVDLEP